MTRYRVLWPMDPGDVATEEAAAGLVGQRPTGPFGSPVLITAAELVDDGRAISLELELDPAKADSIDVPSTERSTDA